MLVSCLLLSGGPLLGCSTGSEEVALESQQLAAVINPMPAWTTFGGQGSASLGVAFAVGDLDDDGLGDVVLGAPGFDDGEESEGSVQLYPGDGSSFAVAPSWTVTSDEAFAFLGGAVAVPGDLNGDGVADLAVAAWQADGAHANEGRVDVYYGSGAGLASGPDLTLFGGQADAAFGYALAGGDFNGDGISDLAVGAPEWDDLAADEGAVFWFAGSSSGLSVSPSGSLLLGQIGERLGTALAPGFDIDGDGDDELLAGAPSYTGPEQEEGRALLFAGSPGGLEATPLWTYESDQPFAHAAQAVAVASDADGDGLADVVVGTPNWDSGGGERGRVELFLGTSSGYGAAADWTWEGQQAASLTGISVLAEDMNGDGLSEVIVGASHANQVSLDEGLVYVFAGMQNDVPLPFPVRTVGLGAGLSHFGSELASAGDANGDGLGDILVGGLGFGLTQAQEGIVTLHLGLPTTVDLDGDGFCVGPVDCSVGLPGGDCDDFDPARYPGADELCDGIDQDCDGSLPLDEQDGDADGWMICSGDCNDSDPAISPSASEVCDNIDHDCDGLTDNGVVPPAFWPDADGDGHGDPLGTPIQSCGNVPAGYSASPDDCDDEDPAISPSALEVTCNGIDEDCSFFTPDVEDRDGDAFTPCSDCQELGTTLQCGDCDDVDQEVNPYMSETCGDGIDQDCDGIDPECSIPPPCDEPDNICDDVSCACSGVPSSEARPAALLLGLFGLALGLLRRQERNL